MEQAISFALLLAGVVAGLLVGWFLFGQQRREILLIKEEQVRNLTSERDKAAEEAIRLRDENAKLRESNAHLTTQLEESSKAAEEKLRLLQDAQGRLADSFKALSSDALHANNRAFLDLAREMLEKYQQGAKSDLEARQKAIDELLRPVQVSLSRVDQTIAELEKARIADFGGLRQQLESLQTTQQQLRSETSRLVHALQAPAVRGRWGEVQLRRVVELAGMVEHCDFEQQASVSTEEGVLRPDLVVHLPGQRMIVVDSKVSLRAYLEALEAPDEATRKERLRDHATQVRSHLSRLAGKSYWKQFADTPEFVVAFLPGETFFSAALEQDPELIEFGASNRVILATPTTLIALLKAVAYGWQHQKLAENAEQIRRLGQTLYERIRTFVNHFSDIRRGLSRTVDSYNKAAASLETRVLSGARRFVELGSASGDEIEAPEGVDAAPREVLSAGEEPKPDRALTAREGSFFKDS
jgi:DNA recombination protein RmuC